MVLKEHVLDFLPAYALDSLDEDETIRVAEHLASCASCRAELADYHEVVENLPLAMMISEPPPGLKDKIMAQAAEATHVPGDERERYSWWQRFGRALGSAPAWGLVSLVLIILLGASNITLWGRLSKLETTNSSSLLTLSLQGTEMTPGAIGMLVISQDGEYGTLVVDGLPSLDDTQQYQLWLIQDGQRTSGGVFSVSDEGYGALNVDSPRLLISYQAFGITIEPAGGSPGPTGDKVLGGQF